MTRVQKSRWTILIWATLALLPACSTRIPAPDVPAPVYGRAVLDTLTSTRYAGRCYDPAQGADRAAAFIAQRFSALGLQPAGTSGYLFPFSFTAPQVAASGLAVGGDTLRLGEDYVPLAGSAPGAGEAVVRMEGQKASGGDEVLVLRAPTRRDYPLADRIAESLTPATRAVVVVDSTLPPFGGNRFRGSVPVYAVLESAWPEAAGRVRFSLAGVPEMRHDGVNVVGSVRGTAVPDSFLVVTAHYDHLGQVQAAFGGPPVYWPGANDNASGTAMLVALAREIARSPLRYTVVFSAMGAEEVGLFGATALAAEPTWPLDRTRFLINLDMTGGGPAVTAFGGSDHPAEFERLQAILARAGAPAPLVRAHRPNSDHWPFVERGVPAFFLISGGGFPQPYHHVRDVPQTLDWNGWALMFGVTHDLLRYLSATN